MIPTLDQLAEILYTESYPVDVDRSRVASLSTRPLWERDLWRRVALTAVETLNTAIQAELGKAGKA